MSKMMKNVIVVVFLIGMQPAVTCATWTWGGAALWTRSFVREHWKPILGVTACAFVYYNRYKIEAPLYKIIGEVSPHIS